MPGGPYPHALVHRTTPAFVLIDEHRQIHLVSEGQAKYDTDFMDMDLVEDIRHKTKYAEK